MRKKLTAHKFKLTTQVASTLKLLKELKNSLKTPMPRHNEEKSDHLTIGAAGEQIAERYLLDKKLTLVAKNWECDIGELDLVFKSSDTLIFVEVKTRIKSKFARSNVLLNITDKKQRKLQILSEIFYKQYQRKENQTKKLKIRIDAVGVILDKNNYRSFEIVHVKAAIGSKNR